MKRSRLIRVNGAASHGVRLLHRRANARAVDQSALLGGSNAVGAVTKKTRSSIKYCNPKKGQICVVQGSQIVYVPGRKN